MNIQMNKPHGIDMITVLKKRRKCVSFFVDQI
jgi:hypothetical protein